MLWVGLELTQVCHHCCEQEELHLGQILSNAAAFANGEDKDIARQILVQASILVQEALWLKHLRLRPLLRVMVAGPLVDKDDCVLWDMVAIYGRVRCCAVGDGERDKTGEAHYLIDEGHNIRQPGLILNGGQPSTMDHLAHLIMQALLYLWIAAGGISVVSVIAFSSALLVISSVYKWTFNKTNNSVF